MPLEMISIYKQQKHWHIIKIHSNGEYPEKGNENYLCQSDAMP